MKSNDKIKELRKEQNMSQEEMAKRMDVTRQAITKWRIFPKHETASIRKRFVEKERTLPAHRYWKEFNNFSDFWQEKSAFHAKSG